MGKTAVFVLSTLQQITGKPDPRGSVVVICHTRELAFQIQKEYERFAKYMPDIKTAVFFGGIPVREHKELLAKDLPHVIVGTPGRMLQLAKEGDLNLKKCKHFILDECDEVLAKTDMRADVQDIFKRTPHEKQVMMFSATLNKEIRPICKKFMNPPIMEIYVDDEKLTLHGLLQHYVQIQETEKNRRLSDLLDVLEFNQVVIFVKTVRRADALNKLLEECSFPSICIHAGMPQSERLARYQAFKDFQKRVLVATDVFGRGIDIERVNIVINYDMPDTADQYLHRVGRAGRFGTKGLAVSFVSTSEATEVLNQVQERFEVSIDVLPDHLDSAAYM